MPATTRERDADDLSEITLTLLEKGDEKIVWCALLSTDVVAEVVAERQRNRVTALKASLLALALRFAPRDVVCAAMDDLYCADDDTPGLRLVRVGGDDA
jgi:hypothetical protein